MRSRIRIEEGRAKPIDLLAKYIDAEDDDLAVEMHEPYTYLNGLTIRDLEDLLVDIEIYKSFETGDAVEFWKEMAIVTDDELKKLQKMDKNSRGLFYLKFKLHLKSFVYCIRNVKFKFIFVFFLKHYVRIYVLSIKKKS